MLPANLPGRNLMFFRAVASLGVFVFYFGFAAADKGYDKEENPTGAYKSYCVPLLYNFELGLCQGISGNINVCAVTAEGVHPLSAVSWLNREIMPKGSPHMDKTIIQGDKSYNDLQKYFHDWVCKQVDPQSLPVVALSESQKQSAACKCVPAHSASHSMIPSTVHDCARVLPRVPYSVRTSIHTATSATPLAPPRLNSSSPQLPVAT